MEPTPESPATAPAPTNGGAEPPRGLGPLPAPDDLGPLRETAGHQARDMLGALLMRLGNPPNPRMLHLLETFAGYYREMAAALATSGDSLFRLRRRYKYPGAPMMMGGGDFDDDGGSPASETFGAQVFTNMMGTVQGAQNAQEVAGYAKALKDATAAGLGPEVIAALQARLAAVLGTAVSGGPPPVVQAFPPAPIAGGTPGPTAPSGWLDEEGAA